MGILKSKVFLSLFAFLSLLQVAYGSPTLVFPKNKANVQDSSFRMVWDAELGATAYNLQISLSPTFSNPINFTNQLVDSTLIPTNTLTFGNYYYWRVNSVIAGVTGPWSRSDTFGYFNASNFSGLSLWLKADDNVIKDVNNNVSNWVSSGPDIDTVSQTVPAKQPKWAINPTLNNKPVIRFAGSPQVLIGNSNLENLGSDGKTIFVVGRSANPTGVFFTKTLQAALPNAYGLYIDGGQVTMQFVGNSSNRSITKPRQYGNYELFETTIKRGDSIRLYGADVFIGGNTGVPAASYNFVSPVRFLVGAYNNPTDNGEISQLNGDIAEMIFYDQTMSDSIRKQVSRYLFDKYAPPVNLGPNHVRNIFCSDTLKVASYFANYAWSTNVQGATLSSIIVTAPGTYSVSATDVFGRITVDTILVVEPNPNYVGNTNICFGGSRVWDTGLDSNRYSFRWSDNSTRSKLVITTAGTYSVTVTDSLLCSLSSAAVTFTIDSFKFRTSLGTNTSFCSGNLLSLQQGASLVTHYMWSTTDTTASISINNPGLYTLTVTDVNGCSAIDSLNVTIRGVGPIGAIGVDTVCFGAVTHFTDLSTIPTPNQIVGWSWHFGDGDSSIVQNPGHIYPAAGTYTDTLVVASNTGCTSTPVTKRVLVRPAIQAFFTDSLACIHDSTRFFDRSTTPASDSINRWFWNFGDGGVAAVRNPRHQFATVANDTVFLIVGSRNGCLDTFSRSIAIVSNTGALSGFSLLSPFNNTNIIDTATQFAWQASSNAVRYVIQVSTNNLFSNIIYNKEVYASFDTASNLPFSLLTYYWRVTAYNLCGDSIVSASTSFTHFRPDLVGSPSFWVAGDGQVVKFPNSRVSQWKDMSNHNNNVAQPDINSAPLWVDDQLNHKPVLRFDGVSNFMNGGDILDVRTHDRAMFLVARSRSASGTYLAKTIAAAANNRYACGWGAGTLTYIYVDATAVVDTLMPPFGSYELVSTATDRNNSFLSLQRNSGRSSLLPGPAGTAYDMNSTFRFLIGANNDQTDVSQFSFLNGDIAEIIFFDTLLTQQNTDAVKRYLYIKYGGGPVSLGPDINIEYGFCGNITLNASDRYVKYRWSTGDSTHNTISVTRGGTYSVTVTDVFDQVYVDTININKPNIALPADTVFCLGDSIKWNVDLGTGYRYHFSTGDTLPVINIVNPGIYSVTVSDTISPAFGGPCFITKTLNFTQDSFRVLASLGPDTTLCRGEYIGLRAQAAAAARYLWNNGTTDSTLLVTASGDYMVTVTSVNGCTAFDTIHVNVSGQVANVSFLVNPAYCIGDTVHFQNFSGIQPPFQIISYLWQFGDGQFDTVASPNHYYSTVGTYTVTLTVAADSGCVKSLSQTLRINALPTPAFTHAIGCANSLVKFTDQSISTLADPIRLWVWDFHDGTVLDSTKNPLHNFANPGIHIVSLTVYTFVGCPKTITDTIEIFPELKVAIGADHLCKCQTVQFHDNSESVSNVAWTWQFPDNTYSNDSNPTKNLCITGQYVISLTVTNAVGCINSAIDTITIFDAPTADFNNPDHCVQYPYQFRDQSTYLQGDTIQSRLWHFGDTLTTSIKRNPIHQYADTGLYNVSLSVITEHGCQDSVTKPVHIIGKPSAAFTFTPNYGGAPLYITFTNRSTSATNYAWDFGDGTSSTDQNTSHTYTQNGKYVVRLVAYNQVGCSDIAVDTVNVVPASLDLLIDTFIVSVDTNNRWTMSAVIINVGSRTVNYFDIYATLGNGNTIVERVTDTLPTGGVLNYNFKAQYFVTVPDNETYICIETRNPDGETDENPTNNYKCAPLKKDIRLIMPYPNPATNLVTFGAVMATKGDVVINLFDATGTNLGTLYNGEAAKGMNKWNVDTELMRSGGYFITIKYKDDVQTVKFVVAH